MKALVLLLVLLPVAVPAKLSLTVDCADIHNRDNIKPSGVYTIFPGGPISPLQVYCDMDTDGGGWTVFQRRLDGSENFYRNWNHYQNGFGDIAGEYWIGLDSIVLLTMRKDNELRVDMEDWEGGKVYAQYSSFSVEPEAYGYTLRLGSYIDGGAGDGLAISNGKKFSTYDNDQDTLETDNCAKGFLGGFWFANCGYANPNGLYLADSAPYKDNLFIAVSWSHWKGQRYSLKGISFKMRPVSVSVSAADKE